MKLSELSIFFEILKLILDNYLIETYYQIKYPIVMILRFLKICLFLMSFVFLTGFVQVASLLGPAFTVASSGNIFKAGAQIIFDNEFKKKTGKSSLGYLKEEVSKNNYKSDINKELKNLVERRVKITHQKIVRQNNEKDLNKDLLLLVEKRVKLTHKKLQNKN